MRKEACSEILATLALAATFGVAALSSSTQSQNPPEPQQPPTAQAPATAPPQSSEGRRITVAGCLQQAPSGPVGTSGSAPSAPAGAAAAREGASGEAKFILANAIASEAAGAPDSSPRNYRLIANEKALIAHVGKKLELSGVDESSAENGPTLRVEEGKIVAEACAQ
jgi:hypothetical protein